MDFDESRSYLKNRMFRVYQADFEDCYTGIEVDGVSGGVILFNEFDMGTVPDPDVMNGDQIGIKLNHQLAGFTIEENVFAASSGNANHTIGIAAENLGEFNNMIRKNSFSGLTIGNEAFGVNGTTGDLLDGLRYVCNVNTNIGDKDFFVDDLPYSQDNISALQAAFAADGSAIATGNQFSSTGDQDDGDFANYGSEIYEYHYFQGSSAQIPDDITGISSLVQNIENPCSQIFCAAPCLTNTELSDLADDYFEYLADYDDFIDQSEWSKAAASKVLMDRASQLMIQHTLVDTTNFNTDTLRAWCGRMRTVSGNLIIAKDLAAAGDYTSARSMLDSIISWFDLATPLAYGISDIETIFGILSARGVGALTQSDIDTLLDISNNLSHAAVMARGILMREGYRFETRYVLPSAGGQQRIDLVNAFPVAFEEILVYPNPTNGAEVEVSTKAAEFVDLRFSLLTIHGKLVLETAISNTHTTIHLPQGLLNGIYIYQLHQNNARLGSGRLVVNPQ